MKKQQWESEFDTLIGRPVSAETIKNFIRQERLKFLEEYNSFLCKYGYTDSDVYAEEPTAIEKFLKENK